MKLRGKWMGTNKRTIVCTYIYYFLKEESENSLEEEVHHEGLFSITSKFLTEIKIKIVEKYSKCSHLQYKNEIFQ